MALPQGIDEKTRWADLPDRALLFLCEDIPESRFAVYDLLTGVFGLGSGYEFESLPSPTLLPLLDCYFLTMDRIRFECMRRLGWVEEPVPVGDEMTIIEQVRLDLNTSTPFLLNGPKMTPRHPGFQKVRGENDFDYGRFLRMHIPDAVTEYRKRTTAKEDSGRKAELHRLDGEK
ncbi:MAG: hypothetical protein AB1512_14095 [Thermodesulfobacteriota bacterium]